MTHWYVVFTYATEDNFTSRGSRVVTVGTEYFPVRAVKLALEASLEVEYGYKAGTFIFQNWIQLSKEQNDEINRNDNEVDPEDGTRPPFVDFDNPPAR